MFFGRFRMMGGQGPTTPAVPGIAPKPESTAWFSAKAAIRQTLAFVRTTGRTRGIVAKQLAPSAMVVRRPPPPPPQTYTTQARALRFALGAQLGKRIRVVLEEWWPGPPPKTPFLLARPRPGIIAKGHVPTALVVNRAPPPPPRTPFTVVQRHPRGYIYAGHRTGPIYAGTQTKLPVVFPGFEIVYPSPGIIPRGHRPAAIVVTTTKPERFPMTLVVDKGTLGTTIIGFGHRTSAQAIRPDVRPQTRMIQPMLVAEPRVGQGPPLGHRPVAQVISQPGGLAYHPWMTGT